MLFSRCLLIFAFMLGLVACALAQGEQHDYPTFPTVGAVIALIVCGFCTYRWPLSVFLVLPMALSVYAAYFINLIIQPCSCYPSFEYAPSGYRSLVVGYPIALVVVTLVASTAGFIRRTKEAKTFGDGSK